MNIDILKDIDQNLSSTQTNKKSYQLIKSNVAKINAKFDELSKFHEENLVSQKTPLVATKDDHSFVECNHCKLSDGNLHCVAGPAVADRYFLLGHEMDREDWEEFRTNYHLWMKPNNLKMKLPKNPLNQMGNRCFMYVFSSPNGDRAYKWRYYNNHGYPHFDNSIGWKLHYESFYTRGSGPANFNHNEKRNDSDDYHPGKIWIDDKKQIVIMTREKRDFIINEHNTHYKKRNVYPGDLIGYTLTSSGLKNSINDQPAVIYKSSHWIGTQEWWVEGCLSRDKDDQPTSIVYKNGRLRFLDWYLDGMHHRSGDKPARMVWDKDGNLISMSFYRHGFLVGKIAGEKSPSVNSKYMTAKQITEWSRSFKLNYIEGVVEIVGDK